LSVGVVIPIPTFQEGTIVKAVPRRVAARLRLELSEDIYELSIPTKFRCIRLRPPLQSEPSLICILEILVLPHNVTFQPPLVTFNAPPLTSNFCEGTVVPIPTSPVRFLL
jgi:hypothetical protein